MTARLLAAAALAVAAGCSTLHAVPSPVAGAAEPPAQTAAGAAEPPAQAAAEAMVLTVTSVADSGPGSLREAIELANERGKPACAGESPQARAVRATTIRVAVAEQPVLIVRSALPELQAPGVVLDGGGATLRQGKGCQRPGGRYGCDGVVVAGPGITVRNLNVAGFTFDGVSVRGKKARDVRVEDVRALDNLDDGIGISDGAGPVLVERCVLVGNGFRTKGKGVLVFDDSQATIRDSVAVGNRDGISVTQRARAELHDVWIVASFDKGLGVSDAAVSGEGVRVIANGDGVGFSQRPPNADGLRIGRKGRAQLSATRIEGNGDAGVVVLDTSSVSLRGCTIAANRGYGVICGPLAVLRTEDTVLEGNGKGAVAATCRGRSGAVRPPAFAR